MSSQLTSSIFSCPFPRIAPRDTSKGFIVRIGLNTKSLDTSGCCLCPKFFEFMKVHAWRPWLSVGSKRLRHKNRKIATFISESHSMSVNLRPKLCKWRHHKIFHFSNETKIIRKMEYLAKNLKLTPRKFSFNFFTDVINKNQILLSSTYKHR